MKCRSYLLLFFIVVPKRGKIKKHEKVFHIKCWFNQPPCSFTRSCFAQPTNRQNYSPTDKINLRWSNRWALCAPKNLNSVPPHSKPGLIVQTISEPYGTSRFGFVATTKWVIGKHSVVEEVTHTPCGLVTSGLWCATGSSIYSAFSTGTLTERTNTYCSATWSKRGYWAWDARTPLADSFRDSWRVLWLVVWHLMSYLNFRSGWAGIGEPRLLVFVVDYV